MGRCQTNGQLRSKASIRPYLGERLSTESGGQLMPSSDSGLPTRKVYPALPVGLTMPPDRLTAAARTGPEGRAKPETLTSHVP